MELFTLIGIGALVMFLLIVSILKMYKRCPSDKALVVYGKTGSKSTSKIIHGGGIFIIPVFQDYRFLSLEPRKINVSLGDALSKQNIRISIQSVFTYAISTEAEALKIAAERFLSSTSERVDEMVRDLIMGQLRSIISNMTIEEINTNRAILSENVNKNVESELSKIGLKLVVEATIHDIKDESGYIDALGKEASSKAINNSLISVAQQEKLGAIGVATEQTAKESETTKQKSLMEISVADNKVQGEIGVAKANALKVQEIEASKVIEEKAIAEAKQNIEIVKTESQRNVSVALAQAKETEYEARTRAEAKRAQLIMATSEAEEIVRTEIENKKLVIEATAESNAIIEKARGEAERTKTLALAEAEAILSVAKAESESLKLKMMAQADGIRNIIESAGGNHGAATSILMLDKVQDIYKMQTEAVANMKIDKLTVWDNGKGDGVKNVVSDLLSAVPPISDILSGQGFGIPSFLAKEITPNVATTVVEETKQIDSNVASEVDESTEVEQ